MPYWAAAGMALGGILGGAAQGGISYASAQQQQEAQREAYQHRYQWTVDDLRKAGLNPVLAAQHGAGSVGSMAQMETPNIASAMQVASQVGMQRAQGEQAATQAAINQHTAREAKATADIAESTADAFKQNPSLAPIRAGTQSGLNPSSAVGAAGQAIQATRSIWQKGRELPEKFRQFEESRRRHDSKNVLPDWNRLRIPSSNYR